MKKNFYKTLLFQLSGVRCAGCIKTIESALKKLPDTENIHINFATRILSVTTAQPAKKIIQIVQGKGYDAINYDITLINDNALQRKQEFHQLIYKTTVAAITGMILALIDGFNLIPSSIFMKPQLIWFGIGLLTLCSMIFSGSHFYRAAWKNLLHFHATMDTLISIGTLAAWGYSMIVVVKPHSIPLLAQHYYFEAAVVILALINLGSLLELTSRGKASQAIKNLLNLQPDTASVARGQSTIEIPVSDVTIGDILRVRPGEKVPVDGIVLEGHSTIDESMITGESMPISKDVDSRVIGSTINKAGTFLFRATQVGQETVLAQIVQCVQQAQTTKPPIGQLADTIASIFVPSVFLVALATAIIWYFLGPTPKSGYILVTTISILVIACPCALGLATPMSVMIGMNASAEKGILFRQGRALQKASRLDTIVFDKTGTLTKGAPEIDTLFALNQQSTKTLLQYAASIESLSEHPFATAVCKAAKNRSIELLAVENFEAFPGLGVKGSIHHSTIFVGSEAFLTQQGIALGELKKQMLSFTYLAQTIIFVAIDHVASGFMTVTDPLREDTLQAIKKLKHLGLDLIMITGDNEATAKAVAYQTGIEKFIAQVLPQEKALHIAAFQKQGKVVGMIGDGINDAPALTQADVGIAIGTGTDIAIEAADITLLSNSLYGIAHAIAISKMTMKNIRQNLFGAFIYNMLSIPIAAGVLYPFFGVLLNPMIASAAMALSSLTVVANANQLSKIIKSKIS